MCFKAYIFKAYNTIRWDYLIENTRLMKFPRCQLQSVKIYLEIASFQILFNGDLGESFKARNGVRQGDPIFPYPFVLGMEGMSSILKH